MTLDMGEWQRVIACSGHMTTNQERERGEPWHVPERLLQWKEGWRGVDWLASSMGKRQSRIQMPQKISGLVQPQGRYGRDGQFAELHWLVGVGRSSRVC